ncbi:MAG: AAA family ATPase [Euryarchaeota archaeon]|nr:AAA family ATPase [Euryarchaeota archaeon]MBT4662554.1 AAA family ATPase [Candidatus Neomarinimicrobiota bacterium]MBT5223818.1 AAA family ATPase [Candidatus Neomarinimicrobiota bacterium]
MTTGKSRENRFIKQIFTFSKKGDDYSLSAGNRAIRDFKKDGKKNSKAKKDLEKTLVLMRNKNTLRQQLKSKQIKRKFYEKKSNRENTLLQCRTKNNNGRLWFIIKDEAPGAIKPTILILGAQLLNKNRQSDRIKNLAEMLRLPHVEMTEFVEDGELIVSEGRSIEFESDWGIRPLLPGTFDRMIKFTEQKMGIRPTNTQLETIMHSKTPIFINGQAGTGKTVMLSLRASLKHIENERDRLQGSEPRRTLITSMSENVVKMMEQNIKQTLEEIFTDADIGQDTRENAIADFNKSRKPDNKKYWQQNEINNFLCFRPFPKMQLDLLPEKTKLIFNDDSRNIKFSRFSNEFFSKRDYTKLGVEQAWFGIRTILRGLCASPEFNSSKEFNYLSEKELELIRDNNSALLNDFEPMNLKELLKCHSDYCKWLEENNYYDDMDLARNTWKYLDDLNTDNFVLFDEIYLDESQDLTDLEFRILLKLLKPQKMKSIILAGDPLQTINPSGFSWSNLRAMLWRALKQASGEEQDVDSPMKLSVNFRTPSNIVDLGNIFLNKRTYYQEESDSPQSSTLPPGKLFILQIGETHKLKLRKLMEQDSPRFIISRHADNKGVEQLIDNDDLIDSEIENPKIYSITQVKGLESKEVLLYCMGSSLIDPDISPIFTGTEREKLAPKEKLKISFELNKMYIGLTRSQQNMYILATKYEVKRLWKSGWFEEGLEVLTDPKEVEDQLEHLHAQAEKDADLAEYARSLMKRYKKDPETKWLKWALSAANKADSFPKDELAEIEAHLLLEESKELSGKEQEKILKKAAVKFRKADEKVRAYDIYVNDLIHTKVGPKLALDILEKTPGISKNPVELRVLKMIDLRPERDDYRHLSNDLNNLPKWYKKEYHAIGISKSISKMWKMLPLLERLNLLTQIVDQKIVLKEQNEKWFEEFVKDTSDADLWRLFNNQLKEYIPNSPALTTKYDSLAEAELEKFTELKEKIKFYKTWSNFNKSREKEFSNKAFLMILETEFETFTPVSINKPKYPFKLKPSEHEEYYDWAIKHGNKYSGRSVDLLLNIGNDKWGSQYNLDSDKFFALWNCIGQKQSKLDLSSQPLSEGTEIDHLNKYLLKLLDDWIKKESEGHSSDKNNKYSGINKTELWIDCEKNSLKMKDLIDFLLLKLPEPLFCISFIECYQPSVPQFQTNFRKVARNHFEKDNPLSKRLRELFCEHKEYDFILKSPSVHNNHKLFVEARKIDDDKISSSPTEWKKAINIYTRLGLSNEATNLRKLLPIDIDDDLITIKAKNTPDIEKIREMLDLFTRAKETEDNERIKEIIITNLFNDKMLTTLLNNHDQLHSKIDILMKDVDVKIEDNLIFNYWKLPGFVLLNELEARKGELTNQHQGMLSRNLEVALRDTLSSLQNLPDVGDQYSTTSDMFFNKVWWEPSGKYKSGSFIALLEQLESKPTQSELKEYLQHLGIISESDSELRPKQVKSLLDYYEGDQLYENNVGLLNIYGRLCK